MVILYYVGDETEVDGIKCIEKRFEPEQFGSRIAEGWVVNPKQLYQKSEEKTNGKPSNKEVREAAKIAGITDWNIARITRLKNELGYA